MPLRSVCVYCGSRPGRAPVYERAARAFGHLLAARGLGLVYGGAHVGLMGAVADAALAAGGTVTGVIPRHLVDKEVAHRGVTELVVTDSMHARKTAMAERADAFVALPGGIGTLEELFEVWTWAQLGLHPKPCGLLNAAGYYDGLIRFLDHGTDEGFIRAPHRSMLLVEDEPGVLLDRCAGYRPPDVAKWVPQGAT